MAIKRWRKEPINADVPRFAQMAEECGDGGDTSSYSEEEGSSKKRRALQRRCGLLFRGQSSLKWWRGGEDQVQGKQAMSSASACAFKVQHKLDSTCPSWATAWFPGEIMRRCILACTSSVHICPYTMIVRAARASTAG